MRVANTPTTTMRLDPELKDEALKILEPLGLTLTGAVNIFLKAVVREKGLPLNLRIEDENSGMMHEETGGAR